MSSYLSSPSASFSRLGRKSTSSSSSSSSSKDSKRSSSSLKEKISSKSHLAVSSLSLGRRSNVRDKLSSSSSTTSIDSSSTASSSSTSRKNRPSSASSSSSSKEKSQSLKRRDSIEITKGRKYSQSSKHPSFSAEDFEEFLSKFEVSDDSYGDDMFEEETKSGVSSFSSRRSSTSSREGPRGILSTSKAPSERKYNKGKRRVTFNKSATLHYMPAHELAAARRARKGSWEPAPEHDELWDGDLQDFRPKALSEDELNSVMRRRQRAYESNGYALNYTYPPSSGYDYGYDEMDELDEYLNDLSFGSDYSSKSGLFQSSSSASNTRKSCYICTSPMNWQVRDVTCFIRDHIAGGDFFCLNFEQHRVDGPMLLQMEERDMRNIGIKRRSDRDAILAAKQELLRGSLSRQGCTCSSSSSSSSSSSKSYSSHDVLDRHSRFLESTQSFLNTL